MEKNRTGYLDRPSRPARSARGPARGVKNWTSFQSVYVGLYQSASNSGLKDDWYFELPDGTRSWQYGNDVDWMAGQPNELPALLGAVDSRGLFDVDVGFGGNGVLCQYEGPKNYSAYDYGSRSAV